MKIALVSPYDFTWPGGVTAHISQLGHQLTAMGHEVKVLAPFSPSRANGHDQNFVPLGRTIPIPSGGSIARISLSAWLYRKVRGILQRENFDVIHLHEPLAPYLPLAVLQCSSAVNIGTFHAFHGSTRMYRWSTPVLKHWFKRLDGRIAVSPAALSHVEPFFPGEYQIIPNGIDLGFFGAEVNPIPELMDGKVNILFVGRLEKRKGLRYLLDAYGRLKWEYPDIRLIVVGPGNPDKYCYRILAERNLQDVVFTGSVDHSLLPRYYRTADIFCSPAIGKESFGIVLLEAMAAAKPIVASRIAGYSYIASHGHQSLLVPPRDGEALADALALLIQNPDLRAKMGAQGRATVHCYRWEAVAQQVVDFYQATIERSNGSKSPRTG